MAKERHPPDARVSWISIAARPSVASAARPQVRLGQLANSSGHAEAHPSLHVLIRRSAHHEIRKRRRDDQSNQRNVHRKRKRLHPPPLHAIRSLAIRQSQKPPAPHPKCIRGLALISKNIRSHGKATSAGKLESLSLEATQLEWMLLRSLQSGRDHIGDA